MPRRIDICCTQCGLIQEVQKEMDVFQDLDGKTDYPCPECGEVRCIELPPLVSIHLQNKTNIHEQPPLKRKLSSIDTPLPDEVRKALADVLFDPCSCGKHAPAEIDQHETDCHVHNHSFMKKEEDSEP